MPNDSSVQGPERLAAQAGSPHEEVQRARLDAGDFGAFKASLLESVQLYADTEAGRKGMGSPVMARLVYAGIESQLDMLLARVSLPDSGDAPRAEPPTFIRHRSDSRRLLVRVHRLTLWDSAGRISSATLA